MAEDTRQEGGGGGGERTIRFDLMSSVSPELLDEPATRVYCPRFFSSQTAVQTCRLLPCFLTVVFGGLLIWRIAGLCLRALCGCLPPPPSSLPLPQELLSRFSGHWLIAPVVDQATGAVVGSTGTLTQDILPRGAWRYTVCQCVAPKRAKTRSLYRLKPSPMSTAAAVNRGP